MPTFFIKIKVVKGNSSLKKELQVENNELFGQLAGSNDAFFALIEDAFAVSVNARGSVITIEGQDTEVVSVLLEKLLQLLKRDVFLTQADILAAIAMVKRGTIDYIDELYDNVLIKDFKNRPVRAKTYGQKTYVQAVQKNDIVFGIGPAGTGKTYLAVVMAVAALKRGEIEKIVITRPAVEAGESLGFLPGDLKEKVDPYLRPIYDALYAILGAEHTQRLMDREVIEIAPLAYMRGRTLSDSFIILDEAQNTTRQQMKMFLTRIGFNSKMIVNGDISQIDLPGRIKSGLVEATKVLADVANISFVNFNKFDVVRNPIVAKIVDAYDKIDENNK